MYIYARFINSLYPRGLMMSICDEKKTTRLQLITFLKVLLSTDYHHYHYHLRAPNMAITDFPRRHSVDRRQKQCQSICM
jgi:hypothetical protein